MKIGILGAGHAGLALYALMVKEGKDHYDPVLYASPSHIGTLKAVFSPGAGLSLFEAKVDTGFAMTKDQLRLTHEVAEVVRHADVLINTLPINAHIPFFDQAHAEVRLRGKTLPMLNLSGGFAIFDHMLKQRQDGRQYIPIASAHTLPYAARVASETGISIVNRRQTTLVSVDNAPGLSEIVADLARFMKTPMPQHPNHLYCAIDRSSYVLHPVITALNFNKIERNEPFLFYKDGLTETAYKLLVMAGHERRQVAMKLGFTDFISPEDRMKNFVSNYMKDFADIRPPTSARHRFFTEDVPYGLVFLRTLGDTLGVQMPVCDAVITMSSAICDTDFRKHTPFDLHKNKALAGLVLEWSAKSLEASQTQPARALGKSPEPQAPVRTQEMEKGPGESHDPESGPKKKGRRR